MIDTPVTTIESSPVVVGAQSKNDWPPIWRRLALAVVMLISIFMNFYQLGQNGFGNLYYASAIRSMLDSWHNFFFVAFDPGGFVSIDKPPLGFWLQTASAKIFGFTPFSIFLPQALAGVLSVLLLYYLVRRHFGVVAGLLAALALAISPISVLTNRNNTIDSTLVLVMLLGAWAVPAGRAQEYLGAYWTPGTGSAAHADHFALLGSCGRPDSGGESPIRRLESEQFRDQPGTWLQWYPAPAGTIRLWWKQRR